MSLFQGCSDILRPGMTFHVIPWMWGIDGDKSCGISDTFYITEDGCGSFFEDVERNFTVKPDTSTANKVSDIKPALNKHNKEKQDLEKQNKSSGKTEKG